MSTQLDAEGLEHSIDMPVGSDQLNYTQMTVNETTMANDENEFAVVSRVTSEE